jgi:hypothetical protein
MGAYMEAWVRRFAIVFGLLAPPLAAVVYNAPGAGVAPAPGVGQPYNPGTPYAPAGQVNPNAYPPPPTQQLLRPSQQRFVNNPSINVQPPQYPPQTQPYPPQQVPYPDNNEPPIEEPHLPRRLRHDGLPCQPTPEEAQEILSLIENQLNALIHGDIQQAYFAYTSEPFRHKTSFEDFQFFVESYSVFTRNKNAFFGNIEFKLNNIVSLQGTLSSTEGEVLRIEYNLFREGSLWKIIGIQLFRTAIPLDGGPNAPNYDFQNDISE